MTFKKVSILVPTRNRLGFLAKMLQSYNATVHKPEQAEIIFRCDADDKETIDYLCNTPHTILIGARHEGYKTLPAFYNEMAKVAKGDLLMCCNDDVIFKTKGWSALILAEANKYPGGIFNFGVNVGLNDDNFPFSIVSRKLVDILGFLNDERLLFSDVFLLDVAKRFNRAIRVRNVTIFHDWAGHGHDETRIHANKHEFDLVFKDVHGNWKDSYRELHDAVVNEAVNKIRSHSEITADLILDSLRTTSQRAASPAYSRKEIGELLRLIYKEKVNDGELFLSNHKDDELSLWANVFGKVFAIKQTDQSQEPVFNGKQAIFFGSLGDTKFLYEVMKHMSNLKLILFDEIYYSHIISPYFLFKKLIKGLGMVVFLNSGNKKPEHFGVHRFINDLRIGFLDNQKHDIFEIETDPDGYGISYELINNSSED